MFDFLQLAVRNIRHRKKRSWLTVLGTLVGILAIVALLSIGQGLENSVQSEFQELGGDKIFVEPGGNSIVSGFASSTATIGNDDLQVVRRTRGVEEATGLVSGSERASFGGQTESLSLTGIPTGENSDLIREVTGIEVLEGRYLRSTDTYNVIISESVAEDRFDDEVSLRSSLTINTTDYRVVGIVESSGTVSSDVYMQMDTARDVTGNEDQFGQIVARISAGYEPAETEENIRQSLRNHRNVDEGEEDFTTNTASDIVDSFQSQLSLIRGFLVGLGAISLLVGAVGIMNTMYTSVTERTQEIGVMKAVGATKWQILRVFLMESAIIGLMGGILGTIFGLGISFAASGIISQQVGMQMTPGVSPALILGALGFGFFMGMISGFFPARKAAKKNPVEALRYEK